MVALPRRAGRGAAAPAGGFGVTGGGLPAEIWHEVMTRVEDGLPATPLPAIVPEAKAPPPPQAGAPGTAQAPKDDPITSLLKNILGKGN